MIQKTTPTLTFAVTGFDLSSYDVYVYVKQMDTQITKTGTVTVSQGNSTVEVTLTEEETLSLMEGTAYGQIWATDGTDSVASEALPFKVNKILNTEIPNV